MVVIAALCMAAPGAAPAQDLPATVEVAGQFALGDTVGFGGISGLEFSDDGSRFVALSDSAAVLHGQVTRNAHGVITALVADGPAQALTDATGGALADPFDDAEGLAVAADGSLYVSFELQHRVEHYPASGGPPTPLPVPRDFVGLGGNTGLEALAIAPDGAIFALPEGPASGSPTIPVFRFQGGRWDVPFRIVGEGTWRPVGADFGPDGRLYLLERDFWGLLGFMSRLRRIRFDAGGLTDDQVLMTSRAGQFGNLEGLSIWQDKDGTLHATLVSDNNFLPFLRSQFVDVVIHDGLDPMVTQD
jgi:hypothetical protein